MFSQPEEDQLECIPTMDSSYLLSVQVKNKPVLLGAGQVTTLYLVKHKQSQSYMLAKYFNENADKKEISREVTIAYALNDTSIFPYFYGIITHKNVPTKGYLMEFLGSVDNFSVINLDTVLFHKQKYISLYRTILISIGEKLSILHEKRFFHGDLRPANIVLHFTSSTNFTVKFVDFGQVSTVEHTYSYVINRKTRSVFEKKYFYIAPELFNGGEFSREADIFAYGYIINLMSDYLGKDFKSLVDKCMDKKPLNRPKIDWIIYKIKKIIN